MQVLLRGTVESTAPTKQSLQNTCRAREGEEMNQKLIDEIALLYPGDYDVVKCALTEYAKRSAEAAPKEDPVAFFAGRRLTPSGTYEFYGYLNGDIQIENGTKLYAHPPADGMVLVPVEPTEEMIRAALDCQDHDPADPPECEIYHQYKAMISAGGK